MSWCLENELSRLIICENINREDQYKGKMNQYSKLSEFEESSRVGKDVDDEIFSFTLTILNWGVSFEVLLTTDLWSGHC